MTTLDQLEALADAATQGPWGHDGRFGVGSCRSDQDNDGYFVITYEGKDAKPNADFIAAANPQTIKQLIALCRKQHNALDLAYSWVPEGIGLVPVDEALAAFDRFNGGE